MTDYILFIPLIISFLVPLFTMPFWIRKAHQIGLIWDDMNKFVSEKVAGSGGIIATAGFVAGVLSFVAYRIFILKDESHLVEILSLLVSVLLLAGIGIIDDLLGWKRGGLSKKSRLIMVLIAAIPLMAINAGKDTMLIPFLGEVSLGYIYPLLVIPIAITGAATTYNFLAGFNGLEAGMGIIILSAITIITFYTGNSWLSIIALCMVFSLLAFLFYNFSPAKVFPGNSITYIIGGLIAIFSILGNFEKIALFLFIPYIAEVFLKARGALKKQSFGLPDKTGHLGLRYDKIYGMEHLVIYILNKTRFKATERRVVFFIWSIEILLVILCFLIFKDGIFLR